MVWLRLIHILAGIFWVGSAVFTAVILVPAARAAGAEGGHFMERLMQQRRTRAALGRELVEQGLEQLPPRAEPMIHRHAGDARPPRHPLQAELGGAAREQQPPGRGDDAGPGLVHRRLAAAHAVRPGGHGNLDAANLIIQTV